MTAVDPLVQALITTQRQMCELLLSVTAVAQWRPSTDEWSFRDVAAHMAVAEQECFLVRAKRLVTEENPQFDYYHNSDRDFRNQSLPAALETWTQTRQQLLAFVRSLPADAFSRYGTHPRFGHMALPDLLRLMHAHDLDHLHDLEAMVQCHHASAQVTV